jgi:hypothetical protein
VKTSHVTRHMSQDTGRKSQVTSLEDGQARHTLQVYVGVLFIYLFFAFNLVSFAEEVKKPNVAGTFYPADPAVLSERIDGFLAKADPQPLDGEIFALISPHAGYDFSGQVAAFGYKLVKGRSYKTVVILAPSHHYAFRGVSVYPEGTFQTPLGDIPVNSDFSKKLLDRDPEISFDRRAFLKEHSLEVQLPFLQKVLKNFKIVPVILGDCSFSTCRNSRPPGRAGGGFYGYVPRI